MSILPQLEHCSSKKMNTWLGAWDVGEGWDEDSKRGQKGLWRRGSVSILLCVVSLILSGDGAYLVFFHEELGVRSGAEAEPVAEWPVGGRIRWVSSLE